MNDLDIRTLSDIQEEYESEYQGDKSTSNLPEDVINNIKRGNLTGILIS